MYVDSVGNDFPMLHANGSVHVISLAIFHSQQRLCATGTRVGPFADGNYERCTIEVVE